MVNFVYRRTWLPSHVVCLDVHAWRHCLSSKRMQRCLERMPYCSSSQPAVGPCVLNTMHRKFESPCHHICHTATTLRNCPLPSPIFAPLPSSPTSSARIKRVQVALLTKTTPQILIRHTSHDVLYALGTIYMRCDCVMSDKSAWVR